MSTYTMEHLAERQLGVKAEGGVLFARKTEVDHKDAARQMVLELFRLENFPDNLRMLTLPGVDWKFERRLLALREPGWMRSLSRRRTYFTSAENNRTIYYSGVTQMPGAGAEMRGKPLKCYDSRGLEHNRAPSFAEQSVKTNYTSFYFCNVDDLMEYAINHDWRTEAAWLDYTGPLTLSRLSIIAEFYQRCITDILVITALKARWDRDTGIQIEESGGHRPWLRHHLPGKTLHFIEYMDTSPMLQFAVRKADRKISPELMRWSDDGGSNFD